MGGGMGTILFRNGIAQLEKLDLNLHRGVLKNTISWEDFKSHKFRLSYIIV